MGYEVFTRQIVRSKNPAITFSPYGRITLNKAVVTQFEKMAVEHILLLWDASRRRIALRPVTRKDSRSYDIKYTNKRNGIGISCKTFLDYINADYSKTRSFLAEWSTEQEMFEIELPADVINDTKQATLIPMETAAPRQKKTRSG